MKKFFIFLSVIILLFVGLITFFGKISFKSGNDTKIGENFQLEIEQQKDIIGSEFYKKYYTGSKLLCINTWATWCQPCVEEMPTLNKIKDKFLQKQVEFLSISIDNDSTILSNFINEKQFNFLDLTFQDLKFRESILCTLEGKKSDEFLLIKSVPKLYIIKDKKLLYKFDGIADSSNLVKLIEKNL